MEKIKAFFDPEDKARFWLHIVITAFAVWALTGIVSLFRLTGTANMINEVIGGLAPCVILGSAILSIIERKMARTGVSERQIATEEVILALFFALVIFAEIVAAKKGLISYGVPLTLAGLAVYFCVRIAGPEITAHIRPDAKDIVRILCCGAFASVVLGKFVSYLAEIL